MTMDQIIAGLKVHIRTHFIGKTWGTLNEMKAEVILYDAAHWEINITKSTSKRTRTYTSSGSKGAQTQNEGNCKPPTLKPKSQRYQAPNNNSSHKKNSTPVKRIIYASCAKQMALKSSDW